ncbi:septal ring lytic transglycosylase RlpA family protein [Hymenobacter cellulosivorans]|uniref:Probable endolytic peptidoglycan transglycosylase RlpA n=1 Tax=Hymenobacter cellulosivorans TaxID=2932249 RepID=A0ABY4FEK7_9BACT|nr:septal ring lytic transglycosylase RlpA family protein [Hymenobacter cellulosivorans]UOQ54389.1 septal ring lytic transglycosylase RlpA family protein [Hymenobacter cellulosivorans]
MMALLFALFTALPQAARATRFEEEKPASASASRSVVMRGRASWYGREHQGHRTSNGERFDRFKYTCAHKTLPFGTKLRVTNPTNGKSVVVRVSDRGPFRHERILDLSEVAARPLDIVRRGAVSVVAEVVPSDTPLGPTDAPENLAALATDSVATMEASTLTDIIAGATEAADVVVVPAPAPTFVVQAGTFGDPRNAQNVQAKIQALDEKLTVTIAESTQNGKPYNRVIVGQFADKAEAEAVKLRLKELGIAGLVRQAENL